MLFSPVTSLSKPLTPEVNKDGGQRERRNGGKCGGFRRC